MIKIEVRRKSDNELIAADIGDNVSIETLKAKMEKKGINIQDHLVYSIDVDSNYEIEQSREYLKNEGKLNKKASEAVMDLINGYGRILSEEDLNTLKTNHGAAIQLVAVTREPELFKQYIEAIDPENDSVITQKMKQNILDELADYGY